MTTTTPRRSWICAAMLGVVALVTGPTLGAQLPPPGTPWQFDVTGFLQEAKVDGVAGGALQGGHLRVNGHLVTVPSNLIVILPANALTWQEIFKLAPLPYGLGPGGNGMSGLALADLPAPMTTYEVHAIGNVVNGEYIAGLVEISQQGLNAGGGYVTAIDYAKGEIQIANQSGGTPVRVQINDPAGRFGRQVSPDVRFTVDPDNPTIRSETGFPMCLPRTDPTQADDPFCPQNNRPLCAGGVSPFCGSFRMVAPVLPPLPAPQVPCPSTLTALDPCREAPIEVGDFISFAGTLVHDGDNPTAGAPFFDGDPAKSYISAHTITDNIAIYTAPGTQPAYVQVEVTIIGTGGLTVVGAGEAAARSRFEGFTTDPSRRIHLYGIDLDRFSGDTSDRDWGTIGIDPGPPNGAVAGRWRFRPPCLPFGSAPTQKDCVYGASGNFLPPTREVRAVVEGQQSQTGLAPKFSTNGIIFGQYHAPILEYIFPENIPGAPVPPNNFETIPFLADGGFTSTEGTLAGQLNPWPGAVAPTPSCTPPNVNPGGPYAVLTGTTIQLSGSGGGSGPLAFFWTGGTFDNAAIANPTYTAPQVTVTTIVPLTLEVSNACGAISAATSITVTAAAPPTAVVNPATQTAPSGTGVTLNGSSSSDPANLALTYQWTQTAGPTVTLNNPASATPDFTLILAPGQPQVVLFFTLRVTNSAGVSSGTAVATVTVVPQKDVVTITGAEYRTGKRRLIITARSSTVSPTVALILEPYQCAAQVSPCKPNASGVWMYDPNPANGGLGNAFTNTGGGLYSLDLVGAPQPSAPPARPLIVDSNLGGTSGPQPLTRIRQ